MEWSLSVMRGVLQLELSASLHSSCMSAKRGIYIVAVGGGFMLAATYEAYSIPAWLSVVCSSGSPLREVLLYMYTSHN